MHMPETDTRADHLTWVRERALRELNGTEPGRSTALASLASDLRAHPATADHAAAQLGLMLMMTGHLETDDAMRKFIDGIQ